MTVRQSLARALFLLSLVVLIGCDNYSEADYVVSISDKAQLLSGSTEEYLHSKKFPTGFFFAVRTYSNLDPLTVGAFADEQFKQLSRSEDLGKAFKKRGVLLVASAEPRLVQVRTGQEFYRQSQWLGLTAGSTYIEHQRLAETHGMDRALISMVDRLAAELPAVEDVPWYKRWLIQDVAQTLYMELGDLALPSESFYGTFLLRPISAARVIERNLMGTWWLTFLLVGVLAYALRGLVHIVIVAPLALMVKPATATALGSVINLLLMIGLAVPSAASAILLAGSRLEDQIAVATLEIPGVEQLAFVPELFNQSTAIGLALLVTIARVAKGFASRASIAGLALLPAEAQQEHYEHLTERNPVHGFLLAMSGQGIGQTLELDQEMFEQEPYSCAYWRPGFNDLMAGIKWGLLAWLFLPLSLSLATFYLWAIPILSGAWSTLRNIDKKRRARLISGLHAARSR